MRRMRTPCGAEPFYFVCVGAQRWLHTDTRAPREHLTSRGSLFSALTEIGISYIFLQSLASPRLLSVLGPPNVRKFWSLFFSSSTPEF